MKHRSNTDLQTTSQEWQKNLGQKNKNNGATTRGAAPHYFSAPDFSAIGFFRATVPNRFGCACAALCSICGWILICLGFSAAEESSRLKAPAARRNTFSIVAYDPQEKEWGVGTASKVLAVGAGVPWGKAGAGALATQSAANVTYGPRGLDLLAKGKSAAEVVKLLTDADEGRDDRQLGIVDAQGNAAQFTGKGCDPWAGAKIGKHYVCLGNLLKSKEVVDSMASAFEKAPGPLAWRILATLEAGDRAGGDKRGKQSAAVLVVRDPGPNSIDGDRLVDLRVDDHAQPVDELARILALEVPRPPKR